MEFWYEELRCSTESWGFGSGDLVFPGQKEACRGVFSGIVEHGVGISLDSLSGKWSES